MQKSGVPLWLSVASYARNTGTPVLRSTMTVPAWLYGWPVTVVVQGAVQLGARKKS